MSFLSGTAPGVSIRAHFRTFDSADAISGFMFDVMLATIVDISKRQRVTPRLISMLLSLL